MIFEIANLSIDAGRLTEFEAAFAEARKVIAQAEGCGEVTLRRSIEQPGHYLLQVEWPTVAHHMEGFRNSHLFAQWRELLGPFFVCAPEVEHYETVG